MPNDEINDDDVFFLTLHLRGIRRARVRFLNTTPTYEDELVKILLAMGISVTTEKLEAIVPHPRRRFGVNYRDGQAILTVTPDAALMG